MTNLITKMPEQDKTDYMIALAIRWWQSFEAPDRSDMEELFELLATRNIEGLQQLVSNLNGDNDEI